MPTSAALQAAQKKYDAQNTRVYTFKLNNKTDADLIEYLDGVPNKQGAIKAALREHIERRKSMFTKQDIEVMIEDYLADHPGLLDENDANGALEVDYDSISFDEGLASWMADAYDQTYQYVLVADDEGNVRIELIGIR